MIRERWRVIQPNGAPCDFHDATREDSEDHMVGEALTGSAPTTGQAVQNALEAGYRIERVGYNH